ncbi:hypothetical protein FrEUN1fDRAFT_2807 [Parafrankia sp. EUN1f]|nr:hypothetical protein FrEUN1fDRAFT_2807 [Parafrankia sp. EUN1f]
MRSRYWEFGGMKCLLAGLPWPRGATLPRAGFLWMTC